MDGLSSGAPAPYGRSCEVCVKAKCKCTYQPGGERCERCTRLDKDCRQPQNRKRRSGDRRSDGAAKSRPRDVARTARLEEKLDKVLESLRPRQGPISPVSNSDGAPVPLDPAHESHVARSYAGVSATISDAMGRELPIEETDIRSFSASRPERVWRLARVTMAEAESSLNEFQSEYLEWFPFLYFPPTMTAEDVRKERPFVWLNIMLLVSHSTEQHQRMGEVIRVELAQAMTMDSEKCLDLLLGLLVFMGWYHRHCQCMDGTVKLSLSLLMQMAISLVFDLQLNRKDLILAPHYYLGVGINKYANMSYPRTLESKRAGLGIFLWTSTLSQYLHRTDAIRWTSYFADILVELESNPQWKGDLILVQQVRLQLVVQRATESQWFDALQEEGETSSLPSSAFIQMLHAKLEQTRTRVPPELETNKALQLTFFNNKIDIINTSPTQAQENNESISLSRYKRMWSTLIAAKNWLDVFFTIPPQQYRCFHFPLNTQLVRCLSSLIDLTTLDEHGWDRELVRAEVDIVTVMDRLIVNFEIAMPFLSTGGEDCFAAFCKLFRLSRSNLASRLSSTGDAAATGALTSTTDASAEMEQGGFSGLFDMDFLDNELFWDLSAGQEV